MAIIPSRRVSVLGAFSTQLGLGMFRPPNKGVTQFSEGPRVTVNLPSFCPNPSHPQGKVWHTLDVRRALKAYLIRIESL